MNKTLLRLLAYCKPYTHIILAGLGFLFLSALAKPAVHYLSNTLLIPGLRRGSGLQQIGAFILPIYPCKALLLSAVISRRFVWGRAVRFHHCASDKRLSLLHSRASGQLPRPPSDWTFDFTIGNDTETPLQLYIQVIGQSIQKIVLLTRS